MPKMPEILLKHIAATEKLPPADAPTLPTVTPAQPTLTPALTKLTSILTPLRPTPDQPAPVAVSQPPTLAERSLEASKRLATRYDQVNQMLQGVEEFFRSLKCPTDAYVYYNAQEEDPERGGPSGYEVLGFVKQKDKWRIVHGNDHDCNDYGPYNIQPLAECPVEVRVRAVSQVEKLYEKIVERKEQFLPEVDAAIAELVKFQQTIQNQKGA